MEPGDLLAAGLHETQGLLIAALSDFSDDDLFARPCANANSAAWQLGHLISEEAIIMALAGATPTMTPPAGFSDLFSTATAAVDDIERFRPYAGKSTLIDLFAAGRSRTILWARSLSSEQLDRPAPGRLGEWAPTINHVLLRQITHTAMHAGQIQVLRRKLGKPVMF